MKSSPAAAKGSEKGVASENEVIGGSWETREVCSKWRKRKCRAPERRVSLVFKRKEEDHNA